MTEPFPGVPTEETVKNGDWPVLYRLPASEDYSHGDEVGFLDVDGWKVAVDFRDGEVVRGKWAVEQNFVCFPAKTAWMITDNDAIEHGITLEQFNE